MSSGRTTRRRIARMLVGIAGERRPTQPVIRSSATPEAGPPAPNKYGAPGRLPHHLLYSVAPRSLVRVPIGGSTHYSLISFASIAQVSPGVSMRLDRHSL